MKTIRSPNLAPEEKGIEVMVTLRRGYARGGLVRAAQAVRGAGRFGDTLLVHINEREFAQLKRAWGQPHTNPETALPEFFDFGGILDAAGGWEGIAKTAAPYVASMLTGKAKVDQANQNLAPYPDANMQRPLGSYTNARQYIPQKAQTPQSYYTYGQKGPETQFYKNNSLGAVTGAIPEPLKGPQQYSPSGLEAVGSGLLGNLLQNPSILKSIFGGGGRTVDMGTTPLPEGAFPAQAGDIAAGDPGASILGGGASEAAGAGGLGAAADAAGAAGIADVAAPTTGGLYGLTGIGAGNLSAAGGAGTAAGTGSGIGLTPAVGGALGAGAIGAGVTAAALMSQPYKEDASWWKRMLGTLKGGGSGNATYDKYTPQAFQTYQAKNSLYDMIKRGPTHSVLGAAGPGIPQEAMELAKQYGMVHPDGSINYGWYQGPAPARSIYAPDPRSGPSGLKTNKVLAKGGAVGYAFGGPVMGGLGIQRPPLPNTGMAPPNLATFKPALPIGPPPSAPPLPPTGMGLNPAWSPAGAPRQNAMPPMTPNGPAPMLPPPGAQIPMPIRQPMMGGLGRLGPRAGGGVFDRRASGGAISGPGTGTSDDIPARLSDGEYVIPAHVVAALGDGSTAAGAKRLDELQRQVRLITGRQMATGKHPKPSKPPIALLTGGK